MKLIKTLADLKRSLKVGQKIEMIAYNGRPPSEKIAGVGTISKTQSNGVYINRAGNNSFMDYPNAPQFIPSYHAGRFEITTPDESITLEYQLITNKN